MHRKAFVALGVLAAGLILAQVPRTDERVGTIDGPELFKQYCAVCHGPGGKGNGPMAKVLKQQPADLTRISARNNGMFPSAKIERLIAGQDQSNASHGTHEMPVWGPIFSQVDRDMDWGKVRIHNLAQHLEKMQAK